MKNWNEEPRAARPNLRLIEQKGMPHDENAEAIVLGALIVSHERLEDVIDVLHADDFYVDRHRALYETMLTHYRVHGQAADFLTLCSLVEASTDMRSDELVELMHRYQELWSPDLHQDVKLIIGTAAQRRHYYASLKLAEIAHQISDPDVARREVETLLYGLTTRSVGTSDFDSLEDILVKSMNTIDIATKNRGLLLGVPTGFTDLDLMFHGLQRTDLIIGAGRPGFGKSSFAMGIAHNAARRGHAVAVFSLEMGKEQLGMRLLSLASGVPANRMRAGWIDEDESQRIIEARDLLSDLCIHIDDTAGSPVRSMRSKLRRLRARLHRDIDLVIVDYLQLMEDDESDARRRENRVQEISSISRGLKALAREFNVPVLALAQLSRAVESRQSKMPQLSDLRESGSIENDADIVMLIYRDEVYNPESERRGSADILVAKHRNGPVGSVSLAFNAALTRFDNMESVSPEEF